MMRGVLSALLSLLACAAVAAGKPIVRVQVESGAKPVMVGQQVRVNVTVLVPNFFGGAPQWPALELDGATAIMQDSAQNVNETIGGETYVGIQKTYLVTPQREGDFTLPPAKIAFKYAAEPGKPPAAAEVTLPATKFTAKLPAGMAPGAAAGPAAKVTVKQTLDRDLAGLKAGDAITRTVDTYALRTQSMMIPPPSFAAPAGVRLYRKDPKLTDEKGPRGEFIGGRRIDTATYVFEKPGDYTLPEIDVAWFNAATAKSENAVAPALKVTVGPGTGAPPAIAPEAAPGEPAKAIAPRSAIPWKALALGAVLVLVVAVAAVWLWRRARPVAVRWLAERERAREESEPAYFARLEAACASGNAVSAYRALLAWARKARLAPRGRAIDALEQHLFAGAHSGVGWDGQALRNELKALRDGAAQGTGQRKSALPALNP